MKTAIWWIRRDLRLADNQALWAALHSSDQLLPVFILDPALMNSPYAGEKRLAFLLAGLRQLDQDLQKIRSRLIVRSGRPVTAFADLLAETGAGEIYAESDHSPYARRRDALVAHKLPLHLVGSPAVLAPGSVLKADGEPYTVFTPFSRAWKAQVDLSPAWVLPAPEKISTPPEPRSERLPEQPDLPKEIPFQPGETQAQRRLNSFIYGRSEAAIYQYGQGRNQLDADGTSKISPYLRFGMLSARQAATHAWLAMTSAPDAEARKSAETWLNEIIWREFYIHILHHFPAVRQSNFRMGEIAWQNDPADFSAWQQGKTGYPVVDAAMRQLLETGWMHNRARMIVASFLTKDLLIDWRWGERWFMQHLIDGDPAANNGGWQWTAGTGTDAAPYFRIFNPLFQSARFDPQGNYIRRWLPELSAVPDEYIHEPWKMPAELQAKTGCKIGMSYPKPIIDHNWARQRVLNVYGNAKKPRG
jgi:deoxyribodipyrimidine photo-lyase